MVKSMIENTIVERMSRMTNWQAVSNHLATEIMQWHQRGERFALHCFWADSNDNDRVLVVDWEPHKNWRHTGIIIDEMKKRDLYLCLYHSGVDNNFAAYFYKSGYCLEDEMEPIGGATEREAIALAAALATGYVEQEKTEAEILLDKLFKEGLYCAPGTEKLILELFGQSFERVREKNKEKSLLAESDRQNALTFLREIREKLITRSRVVVFSHFDRSILNDIEEWLEEQV